MQASTCQSNNPMQRDLNLLENYACELEAKSNNKVICFFYTWQDLSITLGKIQRGQEQIIEEANKRQIPCFIRPTGGKAVLHSGDICYTFIASQEDPEFGGKLKESFCKVNKYITRLVNKVFDLGNNSSNSIELYKSGILQQSISSNCFQAKAPSEGVININSKDHKVIGAAQAMYKKAFIQQGSIQVNNIDIDWGLFNETYTISELLNTSRPLDLEVLRDELNNCLTTVK